MVDILSSSRIRNVHYLKTRVVAAIPCFNTEFHIQNVIEKTSKYVDEVIVIDDGSSDKTAEVARNAGAKVISHSLNRGYGEAIKSCLTAAKAAGSDILVTIDGDGQHDPDEIPLLLDPIINNQANMVIGSRFHNSKCSIPAYRQFGIGIINFLWNFGSRTQVTDTQSGFRAYHKDLLKQLKIKEDGMSISIEIIEIARRQKTQIREVPITCSYKNNNDSISGKAFQHGIKVALSTIRIRMSGFSLKRNLDDNCGSASEAPRN
jgi:glycosyltransferase involved in cell wall biosynthesis